MKRYDAPFFMNIYFYKPSAENTSKNTNHISYIGTRPGVDLQDNKDLFDAYESASPEWDEEISPASAAGHVKYAHERPRSHGLFSSEPVESVKSIQQELNEHKGIVWRGILSLKELDAVRAGFDHREAWEDMLRTTVPLMANEMGITERNLRWVAAFHQEQGHPHVHLVVWEKQPIRNRGVLTSKEFKEIKKTFMNEIYGAERIRLAQEKTSDRDLITHLAKEDLVKAVELTREVRSNQKDVELEMRAAGAIRAAGIPPKLHLETSRELADQIADLETLMPKRGRLAYKFMPSEVKEKVERVADWLLNQPPQKAPLEQYLGAVESMTRFYSIQPEQIQGGRSRAYEDVRKRVSQIILKAASESRKDKVPPIVPKKAALVVEHFTRAIGAPSSNVHEILHKGIGQLRLVGFSKEQQFEWKDAWTKQLEGVDNRTYNRSLETAYQIPILPPLKPAAAVSVLKFVGVSDDKISNLVVNHKSLSSDSAIAQMKQVDQDFETNGSAIDVLRKHLGVKDVQAETVSSFAKVLFAAGLSKDEVSRVIQDWNTRSQANIAETKVNREIHSAEKHCMELKEWGRDPVVSKKEFSRLSKTLQVVAPWMWKMDRVFRSEERSSSLATAQSVWKAVWRGIEQEREQSMAKGELLRKQLVREQVRRQVQSQEQER